MVVVRSYVGRELPTAERQDDGQNSLRREHVGIGVLSGLHADAFGVRRWTQSRGVAQGDITDSEGASFGPAEPGPAHHEQDVGQVTALTEIPRFCSLKFPTLGRSAA